MQLPASEHLPPHSPLKQLLFHFPGIRLSLTLCQFVSCDKAWISLLLKDYKSRDKVKPSVTQPWLYPLASTQGGWRRTFLLEVHVWWWITVWIRSPTLPHETYFATTTPDIYWETAYQEMCVCVCSKYKVLLIMDFCVWWKEGIRIHSQSNNKINV